MAMHWQVATLNQFVMSIVPNADETTATESFPSKLRSVIGQMEYAHEIHVWDSERGIPFRTHMYVPEKHPMTQRDFHEREDEGHVFKVCFLISYYYSNC